MERFDLGMCRCKHDQLDHGSKEGCWYQLTCGCKKFGADNLKYLEMLSKEKEVADLNKI